MNYFLISLKLNESSSLYGISIITPNTFPSFSATEIYFKLYLDFSTINNSFNTSKHSSLFLPPQTS